MSWTRTHETRCCTRCRSDEVLTVSMHHGEVLFWTCNHCEATGWERSGEPVARDAILAVVAAR